MAISCDIWFGPSFPRRPFALPPRGRRIIAARPPNSPASPDCGLICSFSELEALSRWTFARQLAILLCICTQILPSAISEDFMLPHPTDHLGLLRIPGPGLNALAIRFAPLSDRDQFSPSSWAPRALTQSVTFPGWWEIDLDLLGLVDGDYEYEFVVNGAAVAPDPYADHITRFGGYRGIFTIA